jgi:hypothetical protein
MCSVSSITVKLGSIIMSKKNQLLAIMSSGLGMEEDVQDGKLFRERERVIYARLKDLSVLQNAVRADSQEQWMIRVSKTENNVTKGQIRVRKIMPMFKNGDDNYHTGEDKSKAQYVLTAKAEKTIDDRFEVPTPVTSDMFDLFKQLADNGMIKDRFHFPIEGTDLVFEVDAYPKNDGSYHNWVKIDLEFGETIIDTPPLPFEVEEQILNTTEDKDEKRKISELYETIFFSKANTLGLYAVSQLH